MWLVALGAHAADDGCARSGLKKLVPEDDGPAVVVLGERRGVDADEQKAVKVAKTLSRRGDVTFAVQIASLSAGGVDRGPGSVSAITTDLGDRATVVSVDVSRAERKPADVVVAVPPVYIHVLADAMGEGGMPPELETRFVEQVAWIDHQLAAAAFDAWDETGFLVILVDRLHVQGALGVPWQAQRLTSVPVHAALLADADSRCVPGDVILRGSILP